MMPFMVCRKSRLAVLVFFILLGWAFPSGAAGVDAEQLYARARKEFSAARAIQEKEPRVDGLRRCIELLQQVLREKDGNRLADKCLYMIAQSYHTIYDANRSPGDYKSALNYYRMVTEKYPASPLADDAQYLIGLLCMREDPALAYAEFSIVCVLFPKGDMKAKAEEKKSELAKSLKLPQKRKPEPKPPEVPATSKEEKEARTRPAPSKESPPGESPPSPPAKARPLAKPVEKESFPSPKQLDKIQHWSSADYTRVVLYTNAPVSYEQRAVPGDPKARQPGKIFLDLKNCLVGGKVSSNIRVMDAFLQWIRVSRAGGGGVRVTLESGSIERYRAFSLDDPPRLIVDVKGKNVQQTSPVPQKAKGKPPKSGGAETESLARQLGLGVKRIVLDPGHGGKDKGASSPHHTHEKDITLALAKELQEVLQAETGCEVVLTRTRDRYLSLEERTAIANAQKADLFISIHTNAHGDRNLGGIETYFLNLSNDKESARVAAIENATSTRKISDLETILHDLLLNAKIKESSRLASEVQSKVVSKLRTKYDGLRDLGTKQAPFYVLVGAEMPSILIEAAFITNPKEEQLLKDKQFRENLARAIASGIESYIKHVKNLAAAGDRS